MKNILIISLFFILI